MLNTLLEFLMPALLRFGLYLAVLGFGIVGALVTKLGIGSYDAAAETITLSKDAFATGVGVMITGGLTAVTAYLKGWVGRK